MQQISLAGAFVPDTINIINNNFALAGILTQGRQIWVKPVSGSDQNDGLSPQTAIKTLAAALVIATAGANDCVLLCAEGNASDATTARQSATLLWSKDLVHLIGVNDGPALSQRSRVAFVPGYATASELITVSGDGCLFANVQFFMGVASALPTGCMSVTGERNHFLNCHIAGMGNAANDIAGAYSLRLAGGENLFDGCTIGVDTVTLGAAANSQILTALGATRCMFRDCTFLTYTNHATNNNFLRCPASTIDRWLMFRDCIFINPVDAGSTLLTQAAIVASGGSPAGAVLLVGGGTGVFGATDWNSTDSGNVTAANGTVTAASYGLGADVTR